MQRVTLGRSGLSVSRICFGTWQLSPRFWGEQPRDVLIAAMRRALEVGVNFYDTADAYGDGLSERVLGEALSTLPRDQVVVATKVYHHFYPDGRRHGDLSRDYILAECDASLGRLRMDYIDLYQCHSFDPMTPIDETADAMERLVKAGKVRFPAFSAHNLRTAKLLMESGQFSVTQIPFNFVDNQGIEEALPLAKRLDLGLIAMKPLGGGLLSRADLCFKFLKGFDWIVPDPGVEKKEELDEIIDIYEKGAGLSEEDRAEMDTIRREMGDEWCHRCDYCQPCPKGIPISSVLIAKSAAKRMTKEAAAAFLEPSMRLAEECIECGQCASRCPYKLDIPALLKRNISAWKRFKETGIFG